MFSKDFWKDTLERTIYTMAECLLASIAGTAMITQLDWKVVAITTITSGIVTVLKCILMNKETER